MSTSQFTNKEIADYVFAVLGGAGTDAEKAAAINAAADQFKVSRDRISSATGFNLDVVNQYLGALPTAASTIQSAPITQTTGALTNAVDTVTSSAGTDTTQSVLSNATTTGALPTSTTQGALGAATSSTQPSSALDVYGLNWNTAADLETKQGYVQTLLGQGITPDQLKAKIGELDPANANQTAYDSLGIPSASAPVTQTTGALQTAASTTDAAKTTPTGALANAVDTVASSAGTDTTQSALSNVATAASTTQGALSTLTPTVTTAVDPRLSEVKSYWEQTTGDKTYAGLTDDQILKYIVENPSNYKQAIEKAAADLNRSNTIRDAFLSIYDDPSLTGPQKAIKIQQLANTNKVSNAEIAQALGFTENLLSTFLNQTQPNWEQVEVQTGGGDYRELYINPVTGEKVNHATYMQTANTPEAIAFRVADAPRQNFIKNSGLDQYTAQQVWSGVNQYNNPATGIDETESLRYHLTNQLKAQGITDLGKIEKRTIQGQPRFIGYDDEGTALYEDTYFESFVNRDTGKPINTLLFDNGFGSTAYLTDKGIEYRTDPNFTATLAARTGQEAANNWWGGRSKTPGFAGDYMWSRDAAYVYSNLQSQGVLNPASLKWALDENNQPALYDLARGVKIDHTLGGFGKEVQKHDLSLNIASDGRPYLTSQKIPDRKWYKDLLPIAAVLAAIYAPTLLSSLGGAGAGAGAAAGAAGAAELGGLAVLGEGAGAAGTLGLGAAELGLAGSALTAADLGGLSVLGEGAGAAAASSGGVGSTLISTLTSALPTELVEAGRTLYNTFNTVKPYLQAGNALYQASQGNIANALLSGIDAAGSFGVPGAKEFGQVLNAGLAASQGNYFPALNIALNQTGLSNELANTKIAGNFTIGDAVKGATFFEALRSENPTAILNSLGSLTGSQDLKVAAAASSLVNTLNNSNATAFDIAMGVSRVSDALNTASKQPPPTGALPTGGQSTVTGALGTDTTTGAAGSDVVDEYNVTGGGGALITSGNPTEDQQIAIQQRQDAANQALTDYMGPGNDLSREGLVSQLQSLGLTADQAEGYAKQADQQINMQRVGADVMTRYSKIDPEFGTPQLDRNAALEEMVAAGFSSDRANEILNGIDAQNAIKLENKLSVQSAYNNLTKGTGTEEQLRSAMTSAGYTDNEINNFVTKGLGILEGSKLTAGEQAQERVSQLPDVRAEIAAKPTFSEAYKLARDTYGSGATFTWQGKSYSTATAEERPDLSAAGLAAKAMSGDPQFQVALSEKAVQNQRDISQVFSDYAQKGGDLTREGALSRLESLGVTKDQASFYLDQADGKLPLLYDQFKAKVPTGSEDSYRAYIIAFNELKNKGVPTSLINVSGYGASGAKPNYPTFINAISTGFGMGAEAAGNTLKAFGTIGESLGLNTAQMSDYGRRLENIAQELYPQALKSSEDEVKGRFANAKTGTDLLNAIKDSFVNNPGAVAKMIGVEGLQEIPNILLAVSTGGASALIRYSGLLAGLGLDVVESAGLQGAQKVDEGLAKGLTRAQAVKGAVDDMKAAGAVTAVMTAAADKIPFGGTVAKTLIKGSTGEGIEEYVIARATGQDHMSALRQAAFGAMIGGPTEASLQGAGNLTNVTINGDTMIGTYEDGTKVSISEPAGATDLKIDIIKPTDTSVNVSNTLTADLTSGADLTTSINNVVSNNITADLSGTIDSTVKAVIDNGVDLSQGVTDLTSSAVTNTGDTTAVINNVVSSLASNGTDLNANAGSIVTGAVSGGASVTDAVDTTLKAVTANGGNVADAAASIITSVSASGDTAQVANATTAVVNAAITSGSNVTTTTSNAVDAALAASGGSTDAVTQVVGGVASQGNNDATAAAVSSAVTATGDTSAAVNAALTNGGDAGTVLSTASNAAITAGTDTNTAVTNTLTSALNNNVDTATAVDSTVKGALDAGADASVVVNSAITAAVTNNVDTTSAITNTVTAALNNNADASTVVNSAVTTAITNGADTSQVVGSAVDAAVSSGADANTAGSAAVTAAITTSASSGTNAASTLTAATAAAVSSGASTDVITDAVSNATGGSSSVTITSSGSTVTSSTVTGTVTTETTIDGKTGNSQTIISDGNTVTQTVTQGSVTTQTQVNTNTNTATVTETNAQTGQTTTTTIDLNTKVVIDVKETVTGGGGEDTLSGGVTQDTPLTTTLTPSPVSVEPLQVSTPVSQEKPQTPQSRVSLPDTGAAMLAARAVGQRSPEDWLGGKLLGSKERDKFYDPLAELKALQIDQPQPPQSPLAEMAQTSAERGMPVKPYYSYGEEPSIDDILGLSGEDSSSYNEEDAVPVFKSGGKVSPLNIQMMYAKGGHTREDFRDGKHVAGPGDGQSDDIPAWLADGEFVFPADVVSALGNGSTKAGTEKLYDMMHEIRRRARSKHPKDLPPPALKSPLDYVKKGR